MTERNDLSNLALEALRVRATKVIPAQIRSCIQKLSEEQLWWRPNEESNSVGNLVLHVRGAVLHFLCRGVGGLEYERDRLGEFAAGSTMSKQELLEKFDEMIAKATRTFDVQGKDGHALILTRFQPGELVRSRESCNRFQRFSSSRHSNP